MDQIFHTITIAWIDIGRVLLFLGAGAFIGIGVEKVFKKLGLDMSSDKDMWENRIGGGW